ncbi:ketopantoate reductase family protein [Robertmurraya kyonggiensis]|uniref:2-dehydropantoate 2-reductase n=1 Tax=Robertmurraya kyonggiensis TaxID=1037680 RepID=A0A4U1DAM4_9BACI|nr:2-dehydropantoate 2-reductase [Robertmurraya kyonggiensis]TKC19083.1 2-dehydropantoate 2-reductase [Robertmurraya kyonggiensis]
MRVAIMGSGSLGTIIGALITAGGQQVDLIDINKEHVDALNHSGAKITGFMDLTVPVKALLPDEMTDTYDLVFLLTKQVYNQVSLDQLRPHLSPESIVCTLQNGVPEDSVASIIGRERTLGGVVGFGAAWIGPGVSELATEEHTLKSYAFDIGELDGAMTPRLEEVRKILDLVGHCHVSDNIMGIKWAKLLMNATFSGMSAALGCRFGDVLANETAMYSLAHIANETIKVAHAHGIKLEEMQGKDMEFLELQDEHDVPNKMDFYREVWTPHSQTKASMLQDLEKNRKSEIDYINGFVCKKGEEVGIKTPFNNLVVKLVKEAEQKGVPPEFSHNIKHFEEAPK